MRNGIFLPALRVFVAPVLLAGMAAAGQTTSAGSSTAQATVWPTKDGEVVLHNFKFGTGETLPELKLHYITLGTPHRNSAGHVDNAVLLLHGTGGNARSLMNPVFSNVLFVPGGVLDIQKYFLVLPDDIGHGDSSKPSDGLHAHFPAYDYGDMVRSQRLMLDDMKIDHLRLILGTSMGCMQSFVWGETYPEFMDALAPFACLPVEIAGRNRMMRYMGIQAIKLDPAWMNGEYKTQPVEGLRNANEIIFIMGSSPLQMQKQAPTRKQAEEYVDRYLQRVMASTDANNMVFYLNASRNYDPEPKLETIKAPVLWINSADDFINPRNLPVPQQALKRMPTARFRLIPETPETHGHGTHTWAKFWKQDLSALLARSQQ
jgi:homoserine O-acetyltransferase/O-succinyltransferase